ncbi:phosphatidylinositol-glycan-specific phospholipase D-like [Lytechinus variegatus]|uniref:phosphatidylinositol-glycan-specific phospholipase D-like n=1 Tax=Lytechinus variegatus TaxID=7654 RepID=UPI001BB21B99|nr:phosphatidylinositol-glycan-specific phospholipase D-like [Lytechinus variegatus]
MKMNWPAVLKSIFILSVVLHKSIGCGITTHIEIAHRATQYFKDTRRDVNYKQLILENQDAFQAGNPYPDAYYDSICRGGKYHSVSEDTHWSPFLITTIQYIRDHYPQPWNKDATKLVVFLLGFASHQVADVSWHSLGIDQGFLTTMGDINFFGSFPDAHSVGDEGGDVLSEAELDLQYIRTLSNWYVPVKDLYEIYKIYYNNTVIMQEDVIVECTAILFLARLGEKLALSKLYMDYSSKSPFMVEEFESYFLGGVDDMAVWSQRLWHDTIDMLEHGTDVCEVPHNPIYINCSHNAIKPMPKRLKTPLRGLRSRINLHGLGRKDVMITPSTRGIYLSAADSLKEQLKTLHERLEEKKRRTMLRSRNDEKPTSSFYVRDPYARLGQSMAKSPCNDTDTEDLILGSPGYGLEGQVQTGRVYVIYGTNQILHNGSHDLDQQADLILQGFHEGGRFGSDVVAVDINLDGFVDIAVSAPSVGSTNLTYHGEVYVYYGTKTGRRSLSPDITIACTLMYCNFGRSLSSGDFNNDGHLDLLIGSPFAPANGHSQAGMVSILYADKYFQSSIGVHLTEKDMNHTLEGDQEYGWFGNKMRIHPVPGHNPLLLISQPTYRMCANPSCSYSPDDIQSVGALSIYSTGSSPALLTRLRGEVSFQKFGSGFSVGDPFGNGSLILAVGSNTKDIDGEILDLSVKLTDAGQVTLYTLDISPSTHVSPSGSSPTRMLRYHPKMISLHPIALYEGDRQYGRFGGELMFDDITGDGIDDLIVGAPFRTQDISEELFKVEEGSIFVFKGGVTFRTGNATRSCDFTSFIKPCPLEKASIVLSSNEGGSRFGSNLVTWRFNEKPHLVVSAPRNNRAGRLVGEVYVYTLEMK